jgi:hypothetical protein
MVTKFDIGDKVEPKNLQFIVQGIRIYSDKYVTYDIAIMDEAKENTFGNYVIPEDKIDKFFAKGATLT